MDIWSGQDPDVMKSSPGNIAIVCSLAIPLFHCHDMMNQKHFWRLRAPPVLWSSCSHSWASNCRLVTSAAFGSCSIKDFVWLVPRPVSSTKASPMNDVLCVRSTACRWMVGALGLNEQNISRKHRSWRNGPIVDPCPGPYS
jgi:hypothetical protein